MHLLMTSDAPRDRAEDLKATQIVAQNIATFKADLGSGQTIDRIKANRSHAMMTGHVRGPLQFIDGRFYTGLLDEIALS